MGKACAWCRTVLQMISGPSISTKSHSLCAECLEELQSALSTNGLRTGEDKKRSDERLSQCLDVVGPS
jgi:hypothetical protein